MPETEHGVCRRADAPRWPRASVSVMSRGLRRTGSPARDGGELRWSGATPTRQIPWMRLLSAAPAAVAPTELPRHSVDEIAARSRAAASRHSIAAEPHEAVRRPRRSRGRVNDDSVRRTRREAEQIRQPTGGRPAARPNAVAVSTYGAATTMRPSAIAGPIPTASGMRDRTHRTRERPRRRRPAAASATPSSSNTPDASQSADPAAGCGLQRALRRRLDGAGVDTIDSNERTVSG